MKKIYFLLILPLAVFSYAQAESQSNQMQYTAKDAKQMTEEPYKTYPGYLLGEKDGIKGRYVYDTSLIRSVRAQNVDSVKTLLRARVDPNEKNDEGFTPLIKAAETGNLEIIQLLVEAGAEIDTPAQYGITPLMVAAAGGHHQVVSYLINKGASVHRQDVLFKTPLAHAALGGNKKTVNILLKAGAGIEQKDKSGETPLVIALKSGNDDSAAALIRANADLQAPAGRDVTADFLAESYAGSSQVQKAIKQKEKEAEKAAKAEAKKAAKEAKSGVSAVKADASKPKYIGTETTFKKAEDISFENNLRMSGSTEDMKQYERPDAEMDEGLIIEKVRPIVLEKKKNK